MGIAIPCGHDSYEQYKRLIGPLRAKARELGYAVGIHGTLKRDIDLIACPWTTEAVDARTLAEALQAVAREICGKADLAWHPGKGQEFTLEGAPGLKPHGRLCWSIHLGLGPYIDLSVMPRQPAQEG